RGDQHPRRRHGGGTGPDRRRRTWCGQSDHRASRGPRFPGVPVVALALADPALPVPAGRVIERVLLGPLVSPDAVRLARELVAADPVSFPVPVAGAADPVPVRARVRVLVRELVAAVAVRDLPGA